MGSHKTYINVKIMFKPSVMLPVIQRELCEDLKLKSIHNNISLRVDCVKIKSIYMCACVCLYTSVCIYICMYVCVCVCIQGVPGGMCETSGECSLS